MSPARPSAARPAPSAPSAPELLRTIWGIGEILALTIMYEAGNMGRFAGPGHFASYCRCVDATRFSNGKKKGDNNAKNGNKYLA